MKRTNLAGLAILAVILITTTTAVAQQLTTADYARAEKFMAYNTAPLLFRAGVRPAWLPDDRFWYRVTTAEGSEFLSPDRPAETRCPPPS